MKAPVTVRLTKFVTLQILDYFLSYEHIITMDKNLDLTYPVYAVTFVYRHCIDSVCHQPFNGNLASDIIGEACYGNPFILHYRDLGLQWREQLGLQPPWPVNR